MIWTKTTGSVRFLMAALLLAASAFGASAGDMAVRAHIPFDFELRGVKMPAGKYLIATPASGGMITLVTPDGHQYTAVTSRLDNPNNATKARLVFRKGGTSYRLSEVWTAQTGGSGIRDEKRADLSARTQPEKTVELALAF